MSRTAAAAGVVVASLIASACSDGRPGAQRPVTTTVPAPGATSTTVTPDRPRGGVARVGVWSVPDVAALTLGGAAVRALVLPQLFVATPEGRWAPSLVEAGSDALAPDHRSATFRLRRGSSWSDGRPVTVDDLRRGADGRFVAAVDESDGVVTVRFTQPLPGWRRLWSATDSVPAPGPGIWGGPFVLAGSTPGLEVVLRRNERWHGPGPNLEELRLVLVPDATTARLLLARGELDVVMPQAATRRVAQHDELAGVEVDSGPAPAGGWWVGLRLNPSRLDGDDRRGLAAAVARDRFASVLLRGEASPVPGFGTDDGPWTSPLEGDVDSLDDAGTVELTGADEEPMTLLLQRAVQRRVRSAGGSVELRNAETHLVEQWVRAGDYEAAIVADYDPPDPCWTCRWASVDEAAARAADAGDTAAAASLQLRLRDEAVVLPLWRPRPVVAWRTGLRGVRANAYALSAAWNAWEWWRED